MVEAKAVMNPNVITVAPGEDIYEAIRMMLLNGITGLPVVNDDETLVGIITEKDVLRLLYDDDETPGKVQDYMTTDVVSFDQEDPLSDIADSFARNHFRRVPILDKGKLVGIISRKDIISHIKNLKHQDEILEQDRMLEILY